MANNMYYSILTTVGTEKLAQAIITEIPVKLTTIAVGDGNGQFYSPTPDQVQLKRETWRGDINDLRSAEDAANHVLAEGVVPTDAGGWTIREVGIFDNDGDLIAISNYPDTIKPLATSGSGKQVYIQIHFNIDNIAALELIIDDSIVIASRKYVDDAFKNLTDNLAGSYGGMYVGEVASFAELRTLTNLKHGSRLFLRGHDKDYPGQGSGEFIVDKLDKVTVDDNGTVAVNGDGDRLKRKMDGRTVTPGMFGGIFDQDASAAIQAAMDCGFFVNGMLGRYRLSNKIEMPLASSLTFCEFYLDNKTYNEGGIMFGTNCNLNVIVHGTSPTGLYPQSQTAVRSKKGARRSSITVIADGVNIATFGDNCKMCTFNIEAYDITGNPDMSEGYGLLLANSSYSNTGTLKGDTISRHGLYISTGSSNNILSVNLSNVINKAAYNLNSRPTQARCEGNRVSGLIADSFSGVTLFVESDNGTLGSGGIRNNQIVDMTIVCKEGVTQNAILIEATKECETAYGNGWRNVLITGACESTTQPVIRVVNMPRFDSDGIKARVTAKSRILSIEKASDADMGTMRFRNVDILTLSSVTGIYSNIDTGYIDLDGVDVITAGQRYQFSGASFNHVVGQGRSEMQVVTAIVPANNSVVVPVTFKRDYYGARASVTISSAANSTDKCTANYSGMTSAGCNVRLINGTASEQSLSASIIVSGL